MSTSVFEYYQSNTVQLYPPTSIRWLPLPYVYKYTTVSVIRKSLSINVRRCGDFVTRFCLPSGNVFENKKTYFQWFLMPIMDHKLSVNMIYVWYQDSFSSGLVISYLDFLFSIDYPLRESSSFRVIYVSNNWAPNKTNKVSLYLSVATFD